MNQPRRIRLRLHLADTRDNSDIADITLTYRDGRLPVIIKHLVERLETTDNALNIGDFLAHQACAKLTIIRLCSKCNQALKLDDVFDKETEFCDHCKVTQKRVRLIFNEWRLTLDYYEGRVFGESKRTLSALISYHSTAHEVIPLLEAMGSLDTLPSTGIHGPTLIPGSVPLYALAHLCVKCNKNLTLEDPFDKTTALCDQCKK